MVQSELENFNASLLLKQVTIEDGGEYTCEVSETMLETATARVTLKVVALPKVFVKPSLKMPNRSSTLECHVQHFYPRDITIEWVKDSMPLLHQRPLQIEQNGDQTLSTVNRYLYFHETKDVAANISCRVKHESLYGSVKEIPLQFCRK
ncbi:tapasin-related protein-like [Erpetoichthys calabaricus]|uniref:tapasin-related protein-like n=1 Tax=Erpetoichthys calabaricus TaxID=27687 RepID=UPI0022348FF1|nr:tapasin-related protein-like [Erpetoichthys calabaricus]